MNFEKQIKLLKVYAEFNNSLIAGKLSQAYLFLCPDRETNKILLLELAKLLQCDNLSACGKCNNCVKINAKTHPDVLIYPSSNNFMVEDASSIYNNVQVRPMLAKYKVFIINNLDLSTEQAQNKMLKILEEPPNNVVFLISASNQGKVLSTILSRVQLFNVDKLSKENLSQFFRQTPPEVLQVALSYGDGYLGKTLDIINNKSFIENYQNMLKLIKNMKNSSQIPYFSPYFIKDRYTFENNLLILNSFFRDMLVLSLNKQNLVNNYFLQDDYNALLAEFTSNALTNILKKLNKIKQQLDNNVNLTLLADNLLFDILEIKYLCK